MENSIKKCDFLLKASLRTSSFYDSDPTAVKQGSTSSHRKSLLFKSLLDTEGGRRHSCHYEEITTYFLNSKGRIIHILPVVIVSTPEVESLHVNSSLNDNMVARNFSENRKTVL